MLEISYFKGVYVAIEDEFETVDSILKMNAESRGVDAFALSLIKVERQMRRLITFLIFQSEAFSSKDVFGLQKALADRRLYLKHLVEAWNDLCSMPLSELVGDEYDYLLRRIALATIHRNKIFHGQLTGDSLSRAELISLTSDLRRWCQALGSNALGELGYDGMDRSNPWGSFRKGAKEILGGKLAHRFASVAEYENYLVELEKRPKLSLQPTRCDGD